MQIETYAFSSLLRLHDRTSNANESNDLHSDPVRLDKDAMYALS
jgi:hypothetical protein